MSITTPRAHVVLIFFVFGPPFWELCNYSPSIHFMRSLRLQFLRNGAFHLIPLTPGVQLSSSPAVAEQHLGEDIGDHRGFRDTVFLLFGPGVFSLLLSASHRNCQSGDDDARAGNRPDYHTGKPTAAKGMAVLNTLTKCVGLIKEGCKLFAAKPSRGPDLSSIPCGTSWPSASVQALNGDN